MSTSFKQSLKYTSKTEWIIVLLSLVFFELLYHVLKTPRIIIDPLFFLCASAATIYSTFYSKSKDKISINNRLIGAMFAGAFVWQLIEASSKLFAKWAVCSFF